MITKISGTMLDEMGILCRTTMITDQQHANGALRGEHLTLEEWASVLNRADQDGRGAISSGVGTIALVTKTDIDAVLASREPSWTRAQIEAAAKSAWCKCRLGAGYPGYVQDLKDFLLPPAPKTPEERVTKRIVKNGILPNFWCVFLDERDCNINFLEESDAETFRIGKIAQLLQESEATRG